MFRPLGWTPPRPQEPYRLLGTVIPTDAKTSPKAIIQNIVGNQTHIVTIGDTLDTDTHVTDIQTKHVTLKKNGQRRQLTLKGSRWHIGVVVDNEGHEVDSVKYSIDANATGAAGKANASVVAPGKARKHDQKGRGEHSVSWNNPNLPGGMYAIDTAIRSTHGVGNRSMEATASLSQAGEPRVTIQVYLTGI